MRLIGFSIFFVLTRERNRTVSLSLARARSRDFRRRKIPREWTAVAAPMRGASRIDFDAFVTADGGGSHATLEDA